MSKCQRILVILCASVLTLGAAGCRDFWRTSIEEGLSEGVAEATADWLGLLIPDPENGDDDD